MVLEATGDDYNPQPILAKITSTPRGYFTRIVMIDRIQAGLIPYMIASKQGINILPPPHVLAPDVMNPLPPQPVYYPPVQYPPPFFPAASPLPPPAPPMPPPAPQPPAAPPPPPPPISLARVAEGLNSKDGGLRKQALADLGRLIAENPDFQRPKMGKTPERLILSALRNNEGPNLIELLGRLGEMQQLTPNIQLELRKIRNVAERQTQGNPFSMGGFVADLSNTILAKFASNKSTAVGFNAIESTMPAMPNLSGLDSTTKAKMKAFEQEMTFGTL